MTNNNSWFEDKFLFSFLDKMNDPRYPRRALISLAQYDICCKYMECGRYCWSYQSDRYRATAYTQGRYHFISVERLPYKPKDDMRIRWRRLDRIEALYDRDFS